MQHNNPFSTYFEHGRFRNYTGERKKSFFIPSLKIIFGRLFGPKQDAMDDWVVQSKPAVRSQELVITWIGHATFLIQVAGINILTDPVFGRFSVLYPRLMAPGIALEELPPIDYVLISHNHYDHLHEPTIQALKALHPFCTYLVPDGIERWFFKRGIERVRSCQWGDSITLPTGALTFLPAVHWSQRGIFDYNSTLWGSWMIKLANKQIYFAGDTAWGSHFSEIAQVFSHIDIALLPIAPEEPREMMGATHINSLEAGEAFLALKAKHFFPMHWGTFAFGTEPLLEPITRLKRWWNQQGLSSEQLHIVKAGQQTRFSLDTLPLVLSQGEKQVDLLSL